MNSRQPNTFPLMWLLPLSHVVAGCGICFGVFVLEGIEMALAAAVIAFVYCFVYVVWGKVIDLLRYQSTLASLSIVAFSGTNGIVVLTWFAAQYAEARSTTPERYEWIGATSDLLLYLIEIFLFFFSGLITVVAIGQRTRRHFVDQQREINEMEGQPSDFD
jgi:amino acid permease